LKGEERKEKKWGKSNELNKEGKEKME